jgi:ABC-type amino acid transport substrate-binding protein
VIPQVKFLGDTDTVPSAVANHLNGRHLRLGVLEEAPFLVHVAGECKGNDCWTGICSDIVKQLAEDLGFTYEYLMPEDGKWGGYNATTKQWNGMVSELISGRIDMVSAHLSTNSVRKEVIDFSTSFMDSAIAAVVKGESETRNTFFFLSSLNFGVWLSVLVANFVITILLWLVSKLSSYKEHCTKVRAIQHCVCDKCTTKRAELEDKTAKKPGGP